MNAHGKHFLLLVPICGEAGDQLVQAEAIGFFSADEGIYDIGSQSR